MGLLLAPKASLIMKMLAARERLGRPVPTDYETLRDYCDRATGRELNPMSVEVLTGMIMIRLAQAKRAAQRSGG